MHACLIIMIHLSDWTEYLWGKFKLLKEDNQLLPRYEYQLLKTKETCQDVNETLSGKKGLKYIWWKKTS